MRFVMALVVLAVLPGTVLAQAAPHESRLFLDLNLAGVTDSRAEERTFTSRFLRFAEIGTARSAYPEPSSQFPSLDLGGGVMLTRYVGLGATYTRTRFEDVVGLETTIPHPTWLKAAVTGTGDTIGSLRRTETGTHVYIAWLPAPASRLQWRFFGGPSFFHYSANMVSEVLYAQVFTESAPQQTITVEGFQGATATGHTVGGHGGGDVTYFFTETFGIAAGGRFSTGTVTVTEPLSGFKQKISVGGTVAFVGLRVHFGG